MDKPPVVSELGHFQINGFGGLPKAPRASVYDHLGLVCLTGSGSFGLGVFTGLGALFFAGCQEGYGANSGDDQEATEDHEICDWAHGISDG
jgi:hypothetical protein